MSMKKKAIFALLPLVAAGVPTAAVGAYSAPMAVEAAEEQTQLPTIGFRDGSPLIADDGELQFSYLNDYQSIYGTSVVMMFNVYDTGTTEPIAGVPDVDAESLIGTFEFTTTHGFINQETLLPTLRGLWETHNFDEEHALAFGAYLLDKERVYAQGEEVIFTGSYVYDVWPDTPMPGTTIGSPDTYRINDDGGLNHSYFTDIDDSYESFLQMEFGFFSVGSEPVADPVYESQELVVTLVKTDAGFVTYDMIEAAFEESKVYGRTDYFGCVVRIAPRTGVENNPFEPSEWLALSGSHQYNVERPSVFTGKAIYTNFDGENDKIEKAIDGDDGSRWIAPNSCLEEGAPYTYVLVDLGASYDLSSLVIHWEDAKANAYDIYIGNTYVDTESLFLDSFLDKGYWNSASVWHRSYTLESIEIGSAYHTEYLGDEETVTGRYVLIEMKEALTYPYSIFEISGDGVESEYSYAYYALKDALDTTGCASFSNDPAKAEEFHAMLTDLMGQLTEEDKAALRSVTPTYEYDESEDKTAYPQDYMALADYLLAKSEFYSSKTDSPAALVQKGESLNVALGAGLLVISAAATGAFFLLKKKKAN